MYIKLFAAREIQYSKLRIFSFNSYVYNLTRGFIASTRAFNLPTRAFNLATRAFSVLTRGFELVTLVLLLHKLTMAPFKKYGTCIMEFFIPFTCVTLSQFSSITSTVLFIH